jgi:hypothetical protein
LLLQEANTQLIHFFPFYFVTADHAHRIIDSIKLPMLNSAVKDRKKYLSTCFEKSTKVAVIANYL